MNKSANLQNSLMLAPLIGATDSLVTALGVWLIFIVVISAFGASMAALRSRLIPAARLFAGVLLAATLTGCAELAAQVWSLQWHQHSGFYAALIALQCVVLEHTGFFQSAWRERLRLCVLFGALMVGLGLLREFLGDAGLRLATLAPGGFILLGLLIAAWQAWPRPTPSH
ncbi:MULTISPECIES: Rnf-Nqr domain containing protein [unclassified Pseudomonas]|jgi:electron transport complex protein RnfE|uniref:Rnf-Nqr domain containing protein n=1 Tax=unclassified Pseudomonas TaxID=196821 RepID=UPI0002707C85|nr:MULTISPECIES: Rnf-Nqr domain containing protein [unclassified Pseudomonas]EJM93672.1 putative NADH:ubiquinone oxidoreductase, subunit RnfE [Pseudomonas sp. GM67]MBD9547483.1 NADH:quinone oxidoreductase [Pseudomonas sp. PDM01]